MRKLLGCAAAFFCLAVTVQAADVAELAQKLKDRDTDNRRAAAQALAEAGADAKPAVAALTAALKDNDLFVRRFAAQALGAIGPEAREAVPNLSALLKSANEKKEVQEAAALALGKIGPDGVPALVAVVKDRGKEPMVRRSAVLGLGKMGPAAKAAIPALVGELSGTDPKGKKMPNPDSLKTDIVITLGEIATAKDEEALRAVEGLVGGKGGTKDKTLIAAVKEAARKIKARN